MADKLLTLKQAATILCVSYSTAQRIARRGDLPFIKVGALWMIPQSALHRELGLQAVPRKE